MDPGNDSAGMVGSFKDPDVSLHSLGSSAQEFMDSAVLCWLHQPCSVGACVCSREGAQALGLPYNALDSAAASPASKYLPAAG